MPRRRRPPAEAVGDEVTYVVNRNINFTNVCYMGCRFCAFAQREIDAESYTLSLDEVADRAEEAWDRGATEVCIQGGIHPDLPGDFYFGSARRREGPRSPDMHIHAFSPMEVLNGVARSSASPSRSSSPSAEARGLGTIPGTAAEILDDEVRWVLTKGKLPADTWEEIVRTAHGLGIRELVARSCTGTSTRRPTGWRTSAGWRASRTTPAGSPSSSRCRSSTSNAPIYLAGKARPGATLEENLRMHAVARILLDGRHPERPGLVGEDGRGCVRRRSCGRGERLRRHADGGDDLAGWPARSGGSARSPTEFDDAIRAIGRTPAERTTTYGRVERVASGTLVVVKVVDHYRQLP